MPERSNLQIFPLNSAYCFIEYNYLICANQLLANCDHVSREFVVELWSDRRIRIVINNIINAQTSVAGQCYLFEQKRQRNATQLVFHRFQSVFQWHNLVSTRTVHVVEIIATFNISRIQVAPHWRLRFVRLHTVYFTYVKGFSLTPFLGARLIFSVAVKLRHRSVT